VNSPAAEFEERILMQHLLGVLPEAEQERLDNLSVADDTVSARLCDAENNLVDAYVRGQLAGEDLDRFMNHYLTSERRRHKVEFAESLLRLVKGREVVTSQQLPGRATAAMGRRPRPRWIAWAAAVVLAMAAGTAAIDDLRLRRSLSDSTAGLSSLEARMRMDKDDLRTQESQTRALQAEVSRLEGTVTDLKNAPGAVANLKPLLVHIASFLLSAPTRGNGVLPVLSVPRDVGQLSITLRLDDAEFDRYRVSLKSRAGQTVLWQSTTLAPLTSQHGAALKLELPAERVKSGAYRFDVVGFDRGREVAVSSYAFNVDREE